MYRVWATTKSCLSTSWVLWISIHNCYWFLQRRTAMTKRTKMIGRQGHHLESSLTLVITNVLRVWEVIDSLTWSSCWQNRMKTLSENIWRGNMLILMREGLLNMLSISDASIPLFHYWSWYHVHSRSKWLIPIQYRYFAKQTCLLNKLACQCHKLAELAGFVAIDHEGSNCLWLQWILLNGLLYFPLYSLFKYSFKEFMAYITLFWYAHHHLEKQLNDVIQSIG